jgi:two-component system NtrC family sensor kinase
VTTPVAYDLEQFTLKEMTECGMQLRKIGGGAASMEDVAQRTVSFLFETLAAGRDEAQACVLARCFVTAPTSCLPVDLQRDVESVHKLGDQSSKSLILLGTRGIKPEWNDRHLSKNHRVIALNETGLVDRSPMVAELMNQLGIPIDKVARTGSKFLVTEKKRNYNVFYVPDAHHSAAIPDQEGFVAPNNIRSAVGYGGLLPSGNMFAVILFLRLAISHQTALAFRPFSLNTKIALLPFDEPNSIFT